MKLNNLKEEHNFYDFKSIKFKSNDEYNRELFAIGRYGVEKVQHKLSFIEDDLDVQSIFSKEEINDIIGELRYGTSIIVSSSFLGFFKKYYVISKDTLKKYNSPIVTDEYYSLKPKRK